jgi:hypothetical protein
MSEPFHFSISDRDGQVNDRAIPRVATLMISIRNRRFTTKLINAFCDFAAQRCEGGIITIVDGPYIHNILAQTKPGAQRDAKLLGLRTLAAERTRNAERCMRNAGSDKLRFLSWTELVALTPQWIIDEITVGYASGGAFACALNTHVRSVVEKFQSVDVIDDFTGFFLEELPILIYAQYLMEGGTLDCYAGQQLELMWQLDRGAWSEDLPKISALIAASPRMLFADIQDSVDAKALL